MIYTTNKTHLTILAISTWTIVQTICHIFWIINGYLLSICQYKPQYYDVIFVYLTYFYRQNCGDIELARDSIFFNSTVPEDYQYSINETVSDILYHFLNATIERAKLPLRSDAASRTDAYLLLYFVADVAWIVSSVCLIVGVFWERKHKFMSVLFYGPWMLICIFVDFLDVVSSVHYGLDMIYIRSYTTWLKFIGVSNYQEFEEFNDHWSSKVIPAIPSTVVVSILSRVFFIWLINILCFFTILFMATDMCFGSKRKTPSRYTSSNGSNKLKLDTGEEFDLNSSEARIRNWQLFYGAIEASSTMNSVSTGSNGGPSNSTDHNSNSKSNEEEDTIHRNRSQLIDSQIQNSSSVSLPNKALRTMAADPIFQAPKASVSSTNIKMQMLRSQLPWSYTTMDENIFENNQLYAKNSNYNEMNDYGNNIESSRL